MKRDTAIQQLSFFIGDWELEVIHPHLGTISGSTVFEWMETEQYMMQRIRIDQPDFPGSTIVYDYDAEAKMYLQHYFDSRGVTRLYQMSLDHHTWKLWRETSDFSPLDFSQRFTGEINASQDVIQSVWEKAYDGVTWEHDFKVMYRKVL
ncbi:hypothetical protein ATL39_2750 [Sinobaca qinghaiensis]|uniref:DUF1579 domain-containing protein n=1 Tax=Sinobaca qinghaiensis TaxID=342944 RepID=A0A419V079_9BACL|nr:hypothetical protein [Sinobaca qinghaiensis]RKD71354.1 hypothetical protein ATL39_2750 [Sinobaca qinghaiensis]